MMKIGNVLIENPLVLAPMAGITDSPFRRIAKKFGCALVYSEMISSNAILMKNKKTDALAKFYPEEKPLNLQLFGNDPAKMAEAAAILQEKGADFIDINAGCSVPKVLRTGAGAELAKDLPLLKKILKAVIKAVKIPITIKIRKGWSSKEISAFKILKIAENAGVQALAIHARTSAQKYSGEADWGIIKELKEKASIPIIGNGDVKTPEDIKHLLEFTGCDAVMIGRASLGNPWIFSQSLEFLKTGKKPDYVKPTERKKTILEHYKMMMEEQGEKGALRAFRAHLAWYSRSLPESARFRSYIFSIQEHDKLIEAIEDYFS